MKTIFQIGVLILLALMIPIVVMVSLGHLFNFNAMFSFGHMAAFWSLVICLRVCFWHRPIKVKLIKPPEE